MDKLDTISNSQKDTPISTANQPNKPYGKNDKRRMAGLFAALIILGGGVFFLSKGILQNPKTTTSIKQTVLAPSPASIATLNWKTINSRLGYSIQYPDSKFAICIENEGYSENYVRKLPKGNECNQAIPTEFSIGDPKKYASEYKENSPCINVQKQNIKIGQNTPAIEYTYSRTPIKDYCNNLNFITNSVSYEISNGSYPLLISIFDKNDPLKLQILSTFKFSNRTFE